MNTKNSILSQEQRATLIAKLTQKSPKNKFEDYFISNKNPKYMLSSFHNTYQNELVMQSTHDSMMIIYFINMLWHPHFLLEKQ